MSRDIHRSSQRVSYPLEQRAEREMLHDGELGQDFRVEHFQHAFVDLAPSSSDA